MLGGGLHASDGRSWKYNRAAPNKEEIMRRCASCTKLEQLRRLIREIEYLKYTLNSTLYWDKMTYMEKGLTYRGEVMSFLGAAL